VKDGNDMNTQINRALLTMMQHAQTNYDIAEASFNTAERVVALASAKTWEAAVNTVMDCIDGVKG
jgi:hypothetical protein